MAYTTDDLVARYTAANLGKAPDQATRLTIDAFATGTTNGAYTDPQALANTLKLVNGTTAVAIETRQFFVGGAPSAAGLAYLVNSTTNANDLNDAYYAKFSAENRFINFSINLATGTGEGAAAFAAAYGGTGVSYEQTVRTAYDKIIGNSVATAAGVDVEATVKFFSRAENITYLTNFVKANTGYTTASDIDLAVKAALIGEILNAATGAGLGAYATATSSMILDLSDGTLDTDNSAGVNLFTAYPGGGVAGTVYKLAPNADTVTGTAANDTINAFTVDSTGAGASTLTAFDNIDGGNGTDTLNIYTDTANTFNTTIASTATIKNVEVINIFNQSGAGAVGTSGNVEANLFQGAKEIWQSGTAVASVQGVSQGQTIGFGSTATNFNVAVGAAAAATSVTIALKDAHENSQIVVQPVNIANNGVTSVTVTGNLVDSDGDGTVDPLFLGLAAAKNASSVTINTAVDVNLQVAEQAGSTKSINTVDASASKGAISFIGDAATNTIKTGSGADFVVTTAATLKDDAATSGVDETFNASVATGAGADIVIVNTTGTGATSVDTGTGDDAISLASRGSGKLTVVLGDGNDSFAAGGGTVNATDSIDGGAGLDTLTLSLVGSANIGAFSNFEVFDVADLGNNLDIDILASKNTVTEIIGSGSLNGNQALSNVGAGVGFRATADMGTDRLTLTQKTAGALTVTLDSDEASADSAGNTNEVAVTASNATSLNAVFASDYKDALSSVTNTTTINLTGSAAASVAVTSGGAESLNVLNLTSATNGATGRYFLTSVTVTGADHLTLDVTNAGRSIAAGTITETAALTSVDASASTGGLAFDLNDMRVSSTYANIVKLGSGDDVLVGHIGTDAAGVLTAAGSYGVAVQNYEAASGSGAATAQGFDVFSIAGATVANDKTGAGVYVMEDGHIAFSGAGPATLADALVIANTAAESVGETAFFEYLGSTYLFTQGGTVANEDSTIKLVGTTGLHGVDLVGGAGGAVYLY